MLLEMINTIMLQNKENMLQDKEEKMLQEKKKIMLFMKGCYMK